MKGRKLKKPYSPMGSPKGEKPKFNGPETFKDPAAEKEDNDMPPVQGFKARMRLDRPGRKRGGRVGADMAPLSSAAKGC
jgi:hypothetical protein